MSSGTNSYSVTSTGTDVASNTFDVVQGVTYALNLSYTDPATGYSASLSGNGIIIHDNEENGVLGDYLAECDIDTTKTASVDVIKVDVIEMNFKDSVNNTGTPENNNFDIVNDSGNLIVPDHGPEWTSIAGEIGETVYIKNRKVCADVKFKITPIISNKPISLNLYSEGDLDFTPMGTTNHEIILTFDTSGYAIKTFTTYTNKVANMLDRKEYIIAWKGNASGNVVKQHIYTLYGIPCDNYNNSTSKNSPSHNHLKYLLGPEINNKGKWCNGKSTLNMNSSDSISRAIQKGIHRDGNFEEGTNVSNPWELMEKTGICEEFAELMKEGLFVLGIPASKIDRKSVTSSVIVKSIWFGKPALKKLIKFFIETENGPLWINEGVCGVYTDDHEMRYYDLAGSIEIGKGGWDSPTDASDNNLWYEGSTNSHGSIIYEINEQEQYGTWSPTSLSPYDANASKELLDTQIKIISITLLNSNNLYMFSYRTEGVKNFGTKAFILIKKQNSKTQKWDDFYSIEKEIEKKWDNLQSIEVTIAEKGSYSVQAWIATDDNETIEGMWQTPINEFDK